MHILTAKQSAGDQKRVPRRDPKRLMQVTREQQLFEQRHRNAALYPLPTGSKRELAQAKQKIVKRLLV
ncbi:hypothetical protein Strain138_000057 [Pseudogemmatithrix spongiicola]|uniref:Uncharacterized protein n=1 Tax=Pseudogemmatithrix spongiicola TaxID=3062599 RepID=A0AA49JRT6_9BACT|nr:hypothetical protein Strain138_000057 [Gemmatimonadaceae bacterium 'strain 138']WKW13734.1 hypothetical protein Strain318_000057 [Gemmatimonadaceae bacterium 'strain 318']